MPSATESSSAKSANPSSNIVVSSPLKPAIAPPAPAGPPRTPGSRAPRNCAVRVCETPSKAMTVVMNSIRILALLMCSQLLTRNARLAGLTSGEQGAQGGCQDAPGILRYGKSGDIRNSGHQPMTPNSHRRDGSRFAFSRARRSERFLFPDEKAGYCGRVAPERSRARGASR